MKLEKQITICNQLGLHARAATKLAVLAGQFQAEVTLSCDNKSVSAASVLGLLLLESSQGKVVTLSAEGQDAPAAIEAISALIAAKFDEQC